MKRQRIYQLLLVVIAVGLAFYLYRKYRVAPDLPVSGITLRDLSGATVENSSLRGKKLFVHYWATWCGECLSEMPSIEKAYQQVDTNKVVFLMVSDESPEKISAFLSQHNYTMKFVCTTKRLQELGIYTIPTTYIFNSDGDEILSRVGGVDWSDPGMIQLINAQETSSR